MATLERDFSKEQAARRARYEASAGVVGALAGAGFGVLFAGAPGAVAGAVVGAAMGAATGWSRCAGLEHAPAGSGNHRPCLPR